MDLRQISVKDWEESTNYRVNCPTAFSQIKYIGEKHKADKILKETSVKRTKAFKKVMKRKLEVGLGKRYQNIQVWRKEGGF